MRLSFYNIWRLFSLICFVGYVVLILYYTIYVKESWPGYRYNYHLFWSYRDDAAGDGGFYFKENMLNAFLFIPLGVLFPLAFKRIRWWLVFLFSLSLSVTIELVQLILKCGFSELDDVFHNTLGCMVGFFLLKGVVEVINENKSSKNI